MPTSMDGETRGTFPSAVPTPNRELCSKCCLYETESFQSGYVQGGSDGMPILGDFITKYSKYAGALGVPADDLYQALVDTAENTVCPCLRVSCQSLTSDRQTATELVPRLVLLICFF